MGGCHWVTLFAIPTELVKFLVQAGPIMQRPNTGEHFRFYFDDDELELLVNAAFEMYYKHANCIKTNDYTHQAGITFSNFNLPSIKHLVMNDCQIELFFEKSVLIKDNKLIWASDYNTKQENVYADCDKNNKNSTDDVSNIKDNLNWNADCTNNNDTNDHENKNDGTESSKSSESSESSQVLCKFETLKPEWIQGDFAVIKEKNIIIQLLCLYLTPCDMIHAAQSCKMFHFANHHLENMEDKLLSQVYHDNDYGLSQRILQRKYCLFFDTALHDMKTKLQTLIDQRGENDIVSVNEKREWPSPWGDCVRHIQGTQLLTVGMPSCGAEYEKIAVIHNDAIQRFYEYYDDDDFEYAEWMRNIIQQKLSIIVQYGCES